jgi:hypothetical protein
MACRDRYGVRRLLFKGSVTRRCLPTDRVPAPPPPRHYAWAVLLIRHKTRRGKGQLRCRPCLAPRIDGVPAHLVKGRYCEVEEPLGARRRSAVASTSITNVTRQPASSSGARHAGSTPMAGRPSIARQHHATKAQASMPSSTNNPHSSATAVRTTRVIPRRGFAPSFIAGHLVCQPC